MKKFLFLVLLLAGCDSPSDTTFTSEQLVKYNCKPTGEFFITKVNVSTRSTETTDVKYYVYTCNSNITGNRMSQTLIEK